MSQAPLPTEAVAWNVTRDLCLARTLERADSFWTRFRGLLGRDSLPEGHGLLISHCSSVHTIGMGFAIDVLHLDGEGTVRAVVPSLGPWRLGPWVPRGRTVLELPAGASRGTQVGDRVTLG